MVRRGVTLGIVALACAACSAVAGVFGGVGAGGATNPDDSCDRRFAPRPEAFCQEITGTLVGLQFREDCAQKYDARAATTLCPRERVIGGCMIDKIFEDGSRVTDWFYDLGDLDGGVDAFPPGDRALTVAQIKARCADPKRYEYGAHFVPAP